jgi:hypothetical protein
MVLQQVLGAMAGQRPFGDAPQCRVQLGLLQAVVPGWLTEQPSADADGAVDLAINRKMEEAALQGRVLAVQSAAVDAARRQRRQQQQQQADAPAAAQPARQHATRPALAARALDWGTAAPQTAGTMAAAAGGTMAGPSPGQNAAAARPSRAQRRVSFAAAADQLEASSPQPPAPQGVQQGEMARQPSKPALKQATLPTGRRTPQKGASQKGGATAADGGAAGGSRQHPPFGLGTAVVRGTK